MPKHKLTRLTFEEAMAMDPMQILEDSTAIMGPLTAEQSRLLDRHMAPAIRAFFANTRKRTDILH